MRLERDLSFAISADGKIIAGLVLIIAALLVAKHLIWRRRMPHFEIDEAEFGLGDQKIRLKPNDLDQTVAYKIWVELSTRKIGLPIDPEHDVIEEIYDSWYSFFAITRELIKEVPVRKVQMDSTQKIIRLSIDLLNEALRPHLTQWQARFRRWYSNQLEAIEFDVAPQDIQKKFPRYEELVADMMEVNRKLVQYRKQMKRLVDGR